MADRKFGEFGESSEFATLKLFKVVLTINNPLADQFIRQTFFCQTLKFAKLSTRQTFPLYGNYLGHVVSAIGVKPDPLKVEAVSLYPVPTNIKELKQFLGLIII